MGDYSANLGYRFYPNALCHEVCDISHFDTFGTGTGLYTDGTTGINGITGTKYACRERGGTFGSTHFRLYVHRRSREYYMRCCDLSGPIQGVSVAPLIYSRVSFACGGARTWANLSQVVQAMDSAMQLRQLCPLITSPEADSRSRRRGTRGAPR